MKKNKITLSIILIFTSVLVALLFEVCFFNGIRAWKVGNNKGTISLKDNMKIETEIIQVEVATNTNVDNSLFSNELDDELKDESEETSNIELVDKDFRVLKIKFDKMYVDRIKFNYTTDTDIKLNMYITKFNEYGDPNQEVIPITFLKEFNNITKVIDQDADSIEIQLNFDENINLNIMDASIINSFSFNVYRFLLMAVFFISVSLLVIFRKVIFKKIEYLFVIIALCTGLSLIHTTPCLTLYSWDDHIHLDRMYSLYENGIVKTTKSYDYSRNLRLYMNSLPTSYEEFNNIHSYLNKNTNKDGKGIINESKFISYDNYTYIPSAIAIKISKLLNLPYTALFHFGKIVNLLVYVSIMFFAIKRAKVGKKLLFVLALLPSTIFLASQYSRDAIITAGIYFAVSTFLNCYCTNEKMDQKNLAIFVVAVLVASLSKMIYAPVLLLLLILPNDKFKNKKNAKWIKILIIALLLLAMSTFVLPAVNSNSNTIGDVRGGNSSTGSQLEIIKEQPVSFTRIFSKFVVNQLSNQFTYSQTLGRWHNFIVINGLKYYALLIIIVLCSVCSNKEEKADKIDLKLRLFLVGISILITCLICGSMYLSFTPVGYGTITGVQSRYYIPLLFGTYIAFKQNKMTHSFNSEKIMMIISIMLLYIYFFMIYEGVLMQVAA